MILDKRNEFCDNTSLNTGAAGTYNLGNQIDLQQLRDIGAGEPLYLVIVATVGITAGSSGTVAFQLASDSSSTIATNGTQTVHFRTTEFATSATPIDAGTVLAVVALPMEDPAYERYVGIQQVTGTTAISAGAVDAFLVKDVSKWKAYPDA